MTAILERTLHLPCLPSQVQIAANDIFLATPVTKTTIGIWTLSEISAQPVELIGHQRQITCLSLSNSLLLCSGAEDYVIVWNVQKCIDCFLRGENVRGIVIGSQLGFIQQMAFSADDRMVAVCADSAIYMLSSQEEKLLMTLEGHLGLVTCVQFSPHKPSMLVSAGDDRTFKVWDIEEQTLLYQSSIISSSPFISLSMDPLQPHIALGTSDGKVWVFDTSEEGRFHCIHQVDVSKLLTKWKQTRLSHIQQTDRVTKVSSLPSWQQQGHTNEEDGDDEPTEDSLSEAGTSVLNISYILPNSVRQERSKWSQPAKLPFLVEQKGIVSELLETTPIIVISTTSAILIVNARTLEVNSVVSLQDPVIVRDDITRNEAVISLVGSSLVTQRLNNAEEIVCIIGSLLCKELHILTVNCAAAPSTSLSHKLQQCHLGEKPSTTTELASSEMVTLSVLSSVPLLKSSPLNAEMIRKSKSETSENRRTSGKQMGKQTLIGQLDRRGQIVDKRPLVFNDKIKSSGYTKQPRQTMFQPQTKTRQHSNPQKSADRARCSVSDSTKSYPLLSHPPTKLVTRINVSDKPTAISCATYTGSGQSLTCGLANHSAQIFRLPLESGKSKCLTGHNGKVNSVAWSNDNKWLMTSSDDRTACIWSPAATEPLMTFRTLKDNIKSETEVAKDNLCFRHEIRGAQFYYMDKFVLLSESNTLHLYKYSLDPTKSDVKRYVNKSKYKSVASFSLAHSQNITAMSAINSFYSYLVLCAGSNKSLDVFDMNTGQSMLNLTDVHLKPAHVVRQNEGSSHTTLTADAYDLFVTAAVTDCIKLWDLRSASCVRRYEGHQNRSYPCSLALSPCGRYIGTGSEDKSAYIYDIRAASYLHKLTGHSDTVSCVAFNPSTPQMITATLDGKLSLYTDI